MSTIVPRWEWRTFGEPAAAVERRFTALAPEREQESRDLYLVSRHGVDAVKVRGELMDVKHLEEVSSDGLECWRPVLKAAFPLRPEELVAVLDALRLPVPAGTREAYTLAEVLGDVVLPNADVQAIDVRKRRSHYRLEGCMAELTAVDVHGESVLTLALESEDAARVIEAVRGLGLGSVPNTSYPRWLWGVAEGAGRRYAVIDVGTNSVKLHVGERRPDGSWLTVLDRVEITRLGEGLDRSGQLAQAPMERTAAAIAGMVGEALQSGSLAMVAVGTAGLRLATNASLFVDRVRQECGVEIDVVSGDEETRLAYLAVSAALGLGDGSLVVFDTGGGSSQFTFGRGAEVLERFSLDVGAARFTERYGLDGAVAPDRLAAALEAIALDLAPLDGRPAPDTLVGIGGAVTNLAAVKHELATYDPNTVRGTVLELREVDRQIELYRTRGTEERSRVVGLQPGRAEVILAGACIVRTVMSKLGRDSLVVSDRGLRHGVLLERF